MAMRFPASTQANGGTSLQRSPVIRTLALAGLIVPPWFTALVIVQGFLAPDYSHVALPISALAAWPTGWIQNLNFYVSGTLMAALAVGLHRGVLRTRGGVAGVALLVASGIGIVLAGVFPWKMVDGVPTETPPHVVAAIMAFAATAVGFMVFSRRLRADPRWRDLATYTLLSGIVILLLFVTLGWFAIEDDAPLHPWAGLLQRVVCAVWFTCTIVLAVRLRRLG
jgi:hypothetical membrane protein